jgi:hypothetical protein
VQTTWTLFFTKPVAGSTKSRGNLRVGADRISDTTLRSTALFVADFGVDSLVVGRGCSPPVEKVEFE